MLEQVMCRAIGTGRTCSNWPESRDLADHGEASPLRRTLAYRQFVSGHLRTCKRRHAAARPVAANLF
jgi:hypothetical protein